MFSAEIRAGTAYPQFENVERLRRHCWADYLADLRHLNDGHDDHALHFLIWHHQSLVAAARFCAHDALSSVPDPHLYLELNSKQFPGSYGCINRLVVHDDHRGEGFSQLLDQAREDCARRLNCTTMLAAWNCNSSVSRRQSLESSGFVSVSHGTAVLDGEYGFSFPFARILTDQEHSTAAAVTSLDLASLTRQLNSALPTQRSCQD